ncbi:jg17442 [Pararge aegeria aegeria]|uniref:Jg17442 protein n=1 Tax=Pararge aegeria aegeria TaxID=348720 RepID=A0A8S4S596_9NEOP|nr:jg17442 [Pararge aegeria aegeria]
MDRAQSRVFLVDITILYDENLVRTETEKKRKYLDHEITVVCQVESTEIPVSTAHDRRRLSFRGSSLAAKIQKVVLLDSARTVRRFLSLSP